ncbi:hypothetical protein NHQ30_010193 [Ciborinia camelliae]|nr:hypothetical protein NHQ30_010193 [Ciborinia camelliae]
MGRTKSAPIDLSLINSINRANTSSSESLGEVNVEDDRVIRPNEVPPFVTFNNNGGIGGIHELHRIAVCFDCIDFKSTWISQALLQEEEWSAIDRSDGVSGHQKVMRCAARKDSVRVQQDERMQKYMGPSNETIPRPARVTHEVADYPKQLEFPPVDDTINQLASQMRGRAVNGRMSLRGYWEESIDDTQPRGGPINSSREESIGNTQPRGGPRIFSREEPVGKTQPRGGQRNSSREEPIGNTQPRSRPRSLSTEEMVDVDTDDLDIGDPSSSEESDLYVPPPPRQRAPALPAPATATPASGRACINCYERHGRCDRGLPRCSSCVTINANCVYPVVSPRVESSSS